MKIAASTVADGLLVKVGSYAPDGSVELKEFSVPNLEAASRVCVAYVEEEGIGSRDWAGGEVVDDVTRQVVAVVSYNGRVWMPGGTNPEGLAIPSLDLEYDLGA
jgi:hypothetical protein